MTVLNQITIPFTIPCASEVHDEALTALIGRIGLSKAAFFLRNHLARPMDYITFKDEMFSSETVAGLVSQIEAERNG